MPDANLAGRRVLVVEDEYFLADELDRALKAAGATVLGPVPSVEAALELLERETPEAAVLDVNLRGEMAYPVADALAAGAVPFVFTTGFDQAALPSHHAGVQRLEKPVDATIALRALARLLSRRPRDGD